MKLMNMNSITCLALAISLGFIAGAFNGFAMGADRPGSQLNSGLRPEATLRNVRDLAHRLMRAALYVINDVEQRDMVVTGEPMLIQPQDTFRDDKRAIGWAQEAFDLGPAQQPRRKWLDADMAHLGQLVDLLKQDIEADVTEGDRQADVAWDNVGSIAREIENHYQKLLDLTRGPKYDDTAIGKEALAIYDCSKRLEKPWSDVLHRITVLRKEEAAEQERR